MIGRLRCPACGALVGFERSRPHGLWEKSLARLVGLRPYRCESCRSRIFRRGLPVDTMTTLTSASEPHAQAPAAPEGDSDEFQELIREIAATEHRNASHKRPAP